MTDTPDPSDRTRPSGPLNTWQTETRDVAVDVPDIGFDGAGRPVVQGTKQETRTVEEKVAYLEVTRIPTCENGNHHFVFMNDGKRMGGRLLVQCQQCPVGKPFIPGVHRLVDGKMLSA